MEERNGSGGCVLGAAFCYNTEFDLIFVYY